MTLVLRKTFGKFSAGTRVTQLTQPDKTRAELTVEADYTHVTSYIDYAGRRQHTFEPRTEIFEVPADLLVELRSRSENVPAIPRIDRPERIARRKVYEMLHSND